MLWCIVYLLVLLSGHKEYKRVSTSTVGKFVKSKTFFEFSCVFQVVSGQISSERLSLLVDYHCWCVPGKQ